jgi:hypothetical protein
MRNADVGTKPENYMQDRIGFEQTNLGRKKMSREGRLNH